MFHHLMEHQVQVQEDGLLVVEVVDITHRIQTTVVMPLMVVVAHQVVLTHSQVLGEHLLLLTLDLVEVEVEEPLTHLLVLVQLVLLEFASLELPPIICPDN
tara:strand:+ start:134 stop:436 length:303 start_codon:yes stop_codon:yes gene_type:complete